MRACVCVCVRVFEVCGHVDVSVRACVRAWVCMWTDLGVYQGLVQVQDQGSEGVAELIFGPIRLRAQEHPLACVLV